MNSTTVCHCSHSKTIRKSQVESSFLRQHAWDPSCVASRVCGLRARWLFWLWWFGVWWGLRVLGLVCHLWVHVVVVPRNAVPSCVPVGGARSERNQHRTVLYCQWGSDLSCWVGIHDISSSVFWTQFLGTTVQSKCTCQASSAMLLLCTLL